MSLLIERSRDPTTSPQNCQVAVRLGLHPVASLKFNRNYHDFSGSPMQRFVILSVCGRRRYNYIHYISLWKLPDTPTSRLAGASLIRACEVSLHLFEPTAWAGQSYQSYNQPIG